MACAMDKEISEKIDCKSKIDMEFTDSSDWFDLKVHERSAEDNERIIKECRQVTCLFVCLFFLHSGLQTTTNS